jgi:alkanesulfonate monooxygenase SsuD/methylene tetrahydromethanopterin reductase-like flavin-dependent oxidoreductase (luciferase family)
VDVGLSISGLIQQPRGLDMRARLREVLEWVSWARDGGFDYLTTGQHFLSSPYEALQPLPLLARLAPETGHMRLVATVLMPLHQPVELAELTATLDVITGGRLTVSASRGYREVEFRSFGVSPDEATGRMVECIECLIGLWSGNEFSYEGKHHRLQGVTIGILPVQRPHPPVWMAANADAAVRRAARLGLPWNINSHADYATVERQVGLYRQAARESGHDPDLPLPMGRELYCAPSRKRAHEDAARYLGAKYEVYAGWGQDRVLPGRPSFRSSFDELARDRFIVGSPDDCARELWRYTELGVGAIHLRMGWPGMPAALSRQSLGLFASEVLPGLREAGSPAG